MATKTEPKTKYAGLLKRTAPAVPEPVEDTPAAFRASPERAAAKPAAGKRIAKTKDPNKKGYTLVLNIDTHVDANTILKKMRTGEDMSDLTERLLAEWVTQNKSRITQ